MSVMDKNGNLVDTKCYDNWEDFTLAWILTRLSVRLYRNHNFVPVYSGKSEETKGKYNDAYYLLLSIPDATSGISLSEKQAEVARITLTSASTDDMFYIEHFGRVRINEVSRYPIFIELDQIEEDKLNRSVISLTEGFEDDPLKGWVRFHYFYGHNHRNEHIEIIRDTICIYWIYLFFCDRHTGDYIDCVSMNRIDPGKVLAYIKRYHSTIVELYPIEICMKVMRYREEEYEKYILQMREKHRKEIEELLTPGGAGYSAAKERFECNQKRFDDELN